MKVEAVKLQPAREQGLFHEPAFSAVTQRWKRTAHRVTQTKIRDTTAQLTNGRQTFQDATATTVLFLAGPKWLQLRTYDTPFIENMQKLTLLENQTRGPLGGVTPIQRQDGPVTDERGGWIPNRRWPKIPTPGGWDRPSRKSIVKNHKDNTLQPLTYAQTTKLFYIGQAIQPHHLERLNK